MKEILIEQLKKDKELEPYFLWFLKTNLLLPRVMNLVMRLGNVNDINGLEIICSHEKSSRALFTQLEKQVKKEDLQFICSVICQYYIDVFGADYIVNQSPELLILPVYASN
ncbi:MAG TPA: hypothetical protein VIN73_12060 [Vicingaceae bacterium]